tara:strand:+ start:829 stop:936 length:108 start_codon:yes stop_codon:yes gene_type:complete
MYQQFGGNNEVVKRNLQDVTKKPRITEAVTKKQKC